MKRKFSAREINHLIKFNKSYLINKISSEIPVEYMTGFAEFCGMEFIVNKNVLIPRIETEQIIQLAKKFFSTHSIQNKNISRRSNSTGSHIFFKSDRKQDTSQDLDKTQEINKPIFFCDVGTGSGCIGITIAREIISSNLLYMGYISDFSINALKVAKINVQRLIGDKNNIKVLKSDLFNDYPKKLKFDLIIANLPYIPSLRISTLSNSVKDYEPRSALDGGEDGLIYIKKLFNELPKRLSKNGQAILEVDDTHNFENKEVKLLIEKYNEFNFEFVKDINGLNRFWIITLKILDKILKLP